MSAKVGRLLVVAVGMLASSCGGGGTGDSSAKSGAAGTPASTPAASATLALEVKDAKGVTTLINDARAYEKSSSYVPPKVTNFYGLHVQQGEGRVAVPWEKIDRVERKEPAGPGRSPILTVWLVDGKKVDVGIPNWSGFDYVAGQTDLGDFELMLNDLLELRVVRRPSK